MRKLSVHRVVSEQVRIGLDGAEIVDRDNLEILPPGLEDRPQNEPSDASEAVDGYPGCHARSSPSLVMPRSIRPEWAGSQ
jgi:hypothetical protein